MKAQINENRLPEIFNKVSKTAVYPEHVRTKYPYTKCLAKVFFSLKIRQKGHLYIKCFISGELVN